MNADASAGRAGGRAADGPVLIVGATGFVGKAVVEALRARGRAVRAVSRSPRPPEPGVEWVRADLTEPGDVEGLAEGASASVHLATSAVPRVLEHDPVRDVRENLVPVIHLHDELARAGVGKHFFISSGGTVYGPSDRPMLDERDPTRPISSYGIHKLAAEGHVARLAHRHGVHCTVLRPSNPYGPGQDPNGGLGLVASALRRALDDEPIVVWGDGSVVRDYVYVTDVADAIVRALDYRGDEPVLNCGSGQGLSVNEVIDHVAEATGRRPRVDYQDPRRMDVPRSVLSIDRLRRECDWRPRVDIQQGLRLFRAWMEGGDAPAEGPE